NERLSGGVSPCFWHQKGSPLGYDNCDEIGHGRHVDRDLRVGVCSSAKERRHFETAFKVKGCEVHDGHLGFCRSAGLLSAERNPDDSISARSGRRPFGSKRLILANKFRWSSFPAPPRRRAKLFASHKGRSFPRLIDHTRYSFAGRAKMAGESARLSDSAVD